MVSDDHPTNTLSVPADNIQSALFAEITQKFDKIKTGSDLLTSPAFFAIELNFDSELHKK